MEEKKTLNKDGYAICFNEWLLDDEIKNEIRLLLAISCLTAKNGICFASNKYFAELFNETEISISRKIKKLIDKGYVKVEYQKRGCEVLERDLRLSKLLTDDYQNCYSTINQNVNRHHYINNNSINNNKENNNINIIIKESKKNSYKSFTKPTIEDIKLYCEERKNTIDAEKFFDYYESNGWKVGKNSMKDWKAAVRTWEKNEKQDTSSKPLIEEIREGVFKF